MKFIYFLDTNEESVGGCSTNYFFERYFKDLDLNKELRESLKLRIDAESNFELSIKELKELSDALKKRIDEILNDDEFNPFKEGLRERYPQYGDYPLEYNNKVYYPYSKGGEFPLDLIFESLAVYKEQVENHIAENKRMKHSVTE